MKRCLNSLPKGLGAGSSVSGSRCGGSGPGGGQIVRQHRTASSTGCPHQAVGPGITSTTDPTQPCRPVCRGTPHHLPPRHLAPSG